MTSWWARWRLKSPASGLFTQACIQAQIKENVKAPHHLAFVREIHRAPVNSPHKGPVTRKIIPFDDVIMNEAYGVWNYESTTLPATASMHYCDISLFIFYTWYDK